ncbi:MAG: NADH-quinone oxidoreductase subunit M [Methylotenera sp.]|jgi:NADH-quinone oxidoreductase subunit M|uniref:NADH-quinone oxidoreductase subunit M n=1 Tax=Methylotenera sp. TaxID=2051956 RepID=UPI00271DECDF|nr:NADH-quinone oxidoreductase subunit M [Methylotenera sp.]MDO9206532.1 NADH-quinone oxidoreductase subunit M [Methylotenera sp.]MDO9393479.1 NADH-quinone oxidoreductase subunit M [Methylotenera sp.]MDP1523014.1 NADH-quinone oxidoreductase subunit M [Methylotenera sp.]MDP3819823.1 NADH-quinone oxidoreductase subunit M [Methylotenera sp.]MDZ4211112.1 NADH-quinone oxidoreductase subunit M [Methylotenera sp.]
MVDYFIQHVLSFSIWVPVLAGIVVLATANDSKPNVTRWLALLGGIMSFLVTIPLYTHFNFADGGFQFQEGFSWIPAFNINYHLGVDGIAIPLILLTSFTTVIVIISAWEVIEKRVAQYMASFLIMSGLMIGVFSALDAILYYVFWEAMLIPMFLIIGIWGGPNRVYATVKFFLYTLLGSLLMLVAFIYLYYQTGSFDITAYYRLPIPLNVQVLIFLAFFAAFAVKIPMWPVHTWLPDAHVEAPTGGSVVLAAIALKLGGYSFLRFAMPIAPDASHHLSGYMIALSLIAIVYIALVALVQKDMKKLIAYSSISHMGFVTLGFFIFNNLGLEGAVVQMVSHGFISAAMFLCVGVLYDRVHSRQIESYGGVANTMPVFAAFVVLFAMANSGLPGTSGFVGEFMVILGAIQVNFWYAFLASFTLIFGAAYTLWMVKRVFYGEIANEKVAALKDLNKREFLILAILALLVLALGIYPQPLTDMTNATVTQLLSHLAQSKLPASLPSGL